MDNIIKDTKIEYTWNINSTLNRNTQCHEIEGFHRCQFPPNGKYAYQFHLTFGKNADSDNYSYYFEGSSVIHETMDICFFMLQIYKTSHQQMLGAFGVYDMVPSQSYNRDKIVNGSVRIIERKLTYISGNKLYKFGFPEFCSLKNMLGACFTTFHITLGCEITFRDQCVYSPTTNSSLHDKSMQNQFKQLLENEELSDFTIVVDAQEIKVHKAILAARSPVFKTMLTINMAEKKTNQLVIKDIDLKIVKLMIEFIYTNKIDVELNPNEAEQLLMVADKYQLEDLKDLCTNFLKKSLNTKNITQYMLLAARYKNKSLMDAVKKLMMSNSAAIGIACDGMLKHL